MKKAICLSLGLALGLAPALPLLAVEEKAPHVQGGPAGVTVSKTADTDAPELPAAKAGEESTVVLENVTGTAEVEVPQEELVVPDKAKVDKPESPYKLWNFSIGFLGGALVGAAAGVLFLSRGDDGGFNQEKAKVMVPAVAAGSGLVFGLASLLLGATTPEVAKPPKVESQVPLLPVAPVADLGIRLNLSF